jgi:hypothetical protein
MEELLEKVFSLGSAPRLYNDDPRPAEDMLHKDYNHKGSVEKRISDRESQGACRQDELIGGKPPVVK